MRRRSPNKSLAALALTVVLPGCAVVEPNGAAPAPEIAEVAAAGPVEAQHPNRFELAYADQSVVGELQVVVVEGDNTLSDLARTYGLGYDEIVAANPGVDPWLPGVGTRVLLPTQYVLPPVRDGVVLNIAAKRLYYFPPRTDGEAPSVYTFPVGIGRVGWETPIGATTVIAKARDPHWYVPWSVQQEHKVAGNPLPAVVPPGPDNPLGAFVLKLDMPGYLIHGTNKPYGVGMRVSHGCVRLYPEDIEFLFPEVAIGAAVSIMNEPFLLGERDGELFFEAHAPLEDDTVNADKRLSTAIDQFAIEYRVRLPQRATQHIEAISSYGHGVPVRVYAYDEVEYLARAVEVDNVVTDDPDAPTIDEVRGMIDEVVAADEQEETDVTASVGLEGGIE